MNRNEDGIHGPAGRPSIAGSHAEAKAEIEAFEGYLGRHIAGRVPDAVFLEHRLRHGVYGQRQSGVHMMRSKLPLGLIAPDQLEAFADIAEHMGHGVAHLTTRQDIQVHFIDLEQTPDLMRVLNDARMTAREACGNVVRNIITNPASGVLPHDAFDVTATGMALAQYLLRLPDGQNLGRKFKISLSSTPDPEHDKGAFHDLGISAVLRQDPETRAWKRGFRIVVGGGLGAVPHEARVYTEFLPEDELLPLAHAMIRVFGRLGEKQNRARARMKFLVAKMGIEDFKAAVETERATLVPDPAWTQFDHDQWTDQPAFGPGGALPAARDEAEAQWLRTNVRLQRQAGYASVKIRVPQGDLSPAQLRGLAALLRDQVGDTTRIGIDQSLLIRWVSTDRLAPVYDGLIAVGLAQAQPGGLGDTVTCPGADTCKLGITRPRSLARQIQGRINALAQDPRLEDLRIHVSGCPNSCAQHQTADIGLFGAAKTIDGRTVPHFVLMVGGAPGGTRGPVLGDGYARTVLKVPAARVGEAVERLASAFLSQAEANEPFHTWAHRTDRKVLKAMLQNLTELPSYAEEPEAYTEYGIDDAVFQIRRGTGECAGEVVDVSALLLAEADQAVDQAQDLLETGARAARIAEATGRAFDRSARALLSIDGIIGPPSVVEAFEARFYDTGRIFEGVGHYYLHAQGESAEALTGDRIRRLVVEASLFTEEVHSMIGKLASAAAVGAAK